MKILHTNFHSGWGGQSNHILILCRGLAARGHEVVMAVPEGSELARRGGKAGLDVFTGVRFERGLRSLWSDARAMRRLAKARRFDVIHTHGSQDSWATAAALAGLAPRPLVMRTRHNIFPIRDHWANRWLWGRFTDSIACISNAILEDCAAKPYLSRERLALIPSAVDADYYAGGQGARVQAELGLEGRYVAGITGRLREEKGHRYLLEALPQVAAVAPDFILLVVGAGSLEDALRAQARELGVANRVIFTGFRADIADVLAALDLFIMPSVSEGLGTAVIEAAAAGLPIIASDVGGIPDIITHGIEGWLIAPTQSSALAEAILRFYHDRALARRCAEAAASKARKRFSITALVSGTEALYTGRLKRRR
ncbi:MAG: glycosyltransferase family 4 protein [bacterium]